MGVRGKDEQRSSSVGWCRGGARGWRQTGSAGAVTGARHPAGNPGYEPSFSTREISLRCGSVSRGSEQYTVRPSTVSW